jgi:purine-binding chemotaxis protein CheW
MTPMLDRPASLVLTVGSLACAVPLEHVVETMRPLPIEGLSSMPPFVLGLSTIRGAAMPVVDLHALIVGRASTERPSIRRFVSLKLGERRAALAVDTVIGVRELDPSRWEGMPPLLGQMSPSIIEALDALDTRFLLVLRVMRILTDEAWLALAGHEASR